MRIGLTKYLKKTPKNRNSLFFQDQNQIDAYIADK